jgi:hypothetical protein
MLGPFLLCLAEPSRADDRPIDFRRDILPIFEQHCQKCHGPHKQENDLRLDSASAILLGGISGPAVVPGQPSASLLIQAASGSDKTTPMPPEGDPLTVEQIAWISRWIELGAKAPDDETAAPAHSKPSHSKQAPSTHWSFQPLAHPALPPVVAADWPRNGIDSFILARLESAQIQPSPESDRAILIRRLHLDLLGIPPSPHVVDTFVADGRPNAYERIVDQLLASPHYGERWGRHWLDAARYADSNGYTRDFGRQIWKYRDWVIQAINRDMPFDQFTIEQLSGDMLPDPTLDQLIATGFHRNTLFNEEGGTDQEQFRIESVADRIDTMGSVFLGLTIGCARCHEHKYDPISQREYYQLFAFFNNCEEPTLDAPSPLQVARGLLERRSETRAQVARLESSLADREAEVMAAQLAWEKTITPLQRARLPGPLQTAIDQKPDLRDAAQKKVVRDHFQTLEAARQQFPVLEEIAGLRKAEPAIPTTLILREMKEGRPTHIHRRGNFLDPGALVQPDVPAVLPPVSCTNESATRLDFARWLVSPENPLTPRVLVNRHWQLLFGRGIVETENDFGAQGSPPSHPELLDWLATEWIRADWSVKALHRLIVTSATYRQSSVWRDDLATIDPDNRLWARQTRMRFEAEIIRDSALAVSNLWERTIGGPSVFPPQPDGVFAFTQDPKPWLTAQGADRYRRAMYTHLWRTSPYPAIVTFDFPDANTTCTRRIRSNTPLQSLVLANDPVFIECATALADFAVCHAQGDDDHRVREVFRRCLARHPSEIELERLVHWLHEQRRYYAEHLDQARQLAGESPHAVALAERAAWISTCRVLLNVDEFITRE